jgi:hypothetical protein
LVLLDAKLRVTSGQNTRQLVQWHNLPRASPRRSSKHPSKRPVDSLDAVLVSSAPARTAREASRSHGHSRRLASTQDAQWTGSAVAEGHVSLQWDAGVNAQAAQRTAAAGPRRGNVAGAVAAPPLIRLHCMTALGREVLVAAFDMARLWAGRDVGGGWSGSLQEVLSGVKRGHSSRAASALAQAQAKPVCIFQDDQLLVFSVPGSTGVCSTAAAACTLLVGVWRSSAAAAQGTAGSVQNGLGLLLTDIAFCRLLLPHSALLQAALHEERTYHAAQPGSRISRPRDTHQAVTATPSVQQLLERLLPEAWHSWAFRNDTLAVPSAAGTAVEPRERMAPPLRALHNSSQPMGKSSSGTPSGLPRPLGQARRKKGGLTAAASVGQCADAAVPPLQASSLSFLRPVRAHIQAVLPIWCQDLDAVAAACALVTSDGVPRVPPMRAAKTQSIDRALRIPPWLCPEVPLSVSASSRSARLPPSEAHPPEFAVHVCFRGLHESRTRSKLTQGKKTQPLQAKSSAFSWVGDAQQSAEDERETTARIGDASVWDSGRNSTAVYISRQLTHVECQWRSQHSNITRADPLQRDADIKMAALQQMHTSAPASQAARPGWNSEWSRPTEKSCAVNEWTFDSQAANEDHGRDSYMHSARMEMRDLSEDATRSASLDAALIGRGDYTGQTAPRIKHNLHVPPVEHGSAQSAVLCCVQELGGMVQGALSSASSGAFHSSNALGELAQWAVYPWPPQLKWPTTGSGNRSSFAALQHCSQNTLVVEVVVSAPSGAACFMGACVAKCKVQGEQTQRDQVFRIEAVFPTGGSEQVALHACVMSSGGGGVQDWGVRSCDIYIPPAAAKAWSTLI